MITNEALMVLENELTFASEVSRDYDDQFAVVGAKIGNVVNARRPARFVGTTGPALNVEDFNETVCPGHPHHAVPRRYAVHDAGPRAVARSLQRPRAEARHRRDRQQDRPRRPADGEERTANIVGVPGTPPTGLITYLTAAAFLDAEGAPRDGRRCVVVEPFTSATSSIR
jgi:hypothetical protein